MQVTLRLNDDDPIMIQKVDHDWIIIDLNQESLAIVTFAMTPKTLTELIDHVGEIRHRIRFRSKYLLPLLDEGLLAMTLPDKPKSKSQQYVTTEKGKALLRK